MAASGSRNSPPKRDPDIIVDWELEVLWHEDVETWFIKHTAHETKKGRYRHGGWLGDFLYNVQIHLHDKFVHAWSSTFIRKRLEDLEKRYNLFTWLKHQPGVVCDEKYKLHATEEKWDAFIEIDPGASLYKKLPEKNYDDLKVIFEGYTPTPFDEDF